MKVKCKQINGEYVERDTSEMSFRISAYGVIVKENKLLVVEEFDGFSIPGGGIELGETPQETVIREIKEETGYKVKVEKVLLVGSTYFIKPDDLKAVETIYLYFLCSLLDDERGETGYDEMERETMKEPEWINLEELNNLNIITPAPVTDILESLN